MEATAEAQSRLARHGCIRARLELAAPEAGGRRQAVRSGWLAAWDIGNEADGQRPDNDAMVVPESKSAIEPGSTALVRIFPESPHRWAKVGVGDVIAMRDGARRIGTARVVELVEPTNEHLIGRWPMFGAVRFRQDTDEVPAGTVGAILDVFPGAYEIEVVGPDGETIWAGPVPEEDLELTSERLSGSIDERDRSAGDGVAQTAESLIWREIDYATAWRSFEAAFDFRPNFYEGSAPAIRVPEDAVVVDLRPLFASPGARFAAGEAAVNAAAARAFVWTCGDEELTALDWQHTPYRYSPAKHVLAGAEWRIPVFPDGDYYVHTTDDLRLGTFGHPWQQWLCVWGLELVDALATELLTWLPRRQLLA